jgi:hypothetical protein
LAHSTKSIFGWQIEQKAKKQIRINGSGKRQKMYSRLRARIRGNNKKQHLPFADDL